MKEKVSDLQVREGGCLLVTKIEKRGKFCSKIVENSFKETEIFVST